MKAAQEREFATQSKANGMMEDVDALFDETRAMMEAAHKFKVVHYEAKLSAVREERILSAAKQAQAHAKLGRESRGFEAIINTLKQKHKKEMEQLESKKETQLYNERERERDLASFLLRRILRRLPDYPRREKSSKLQDRLDVKSDQLLEQKAIRRRLNQQSTNTKARLEDDIDYLYQWLDEMAEELSETKRIAKKQVKSAKKQAAYNVKLAQ